MRRWALGAQRRIAPLAAQQWRYIAGDGKDDEDIQELEKALSGQTDESHEPTPAAATAEKKSETIEVVLERLSRPPQKYDILTNTAVYRWRTTAKHGRKICGPMREWSDEFKYRTGVHVTMDAVTPVDPENTTLMADDVEVDVHLFGADRAVRQASSLIKAMVKQDPSYVRLAVFRQRAGVQEWLTLRRINRENRPPDIPPISLKTPGKWTLLFEDFKEAAIRTLYEETGIHVDDKKVVATAQFRNSPAQYYWRVPVRYFLAEVSDETEVLGPQANTMNYMSGWDANVLRQSADPIDRAWASFADPKTGCAWLTAKQLDELQFPLKGEKYMETRYSPPPASDLRSIVKFD